MHYSPTGSDFSQPHIQKHRQWETIRARRLEKEKNSSEALRCLTIILTVQNRLFRPHHSTSIRN